MMNKKQERNNLYLGITGLCTTLIALGGGLMYPTDISFLYMFILATLGTSIAINKMMYADLKNDIMRINK